MASKYIIGGIVGIGLGYAISKIIDAYLSDSENERDEYIREGMIEIFTKNFEKIVQELEQSNSKDVGTVMKNICREDISNLEDETKEKFGSNFDPKDFSEKITNMLDSEEIKKMINNLVNKFGDDTSPNNPVWIGSNVIKGHGNCIHVLFFDGLSH